MLDKHIVIMYNLSKTRHRQKTAVIEMEIRVLRYFLAIAREGSITNASNFLHITQPTLSRQIKDLEEELGQPLFIRNSHSMTLTPEGMYLRKRAEEILSIVDKTEAEFRATEDLISGDIYIGGGEIEAIKLIAEILKELRKDYPSINIHIFSGNSGDVTERLDKGLLDFGILIQPADISKYDYINLPAKDTWGVLMRKDSPLAQKDFIEKKDLLNVPLLCSRQAIAQKSNNEFTDWFGEDFASLNITMTFNLVYNAAIMVETGLGYAIILDKIANTSETSALCFKPLYPKLESGLNIVWKKHQIFSKPAEVFLKRLQNTFGEI